MKIIGVHCPYCGGAVKFDIDAGQKSCFCVHCGQQIILDDEVIRTEHIERHIDEARIHEADINERIKLKELELKLLKQRREERKSKVILILRLICVGALLTAIITTAVGLYVGNYMLSYTALAIAVIMLFVGMIMLD